MRLQDARLCLDCDEIHQDGLCPVCGSESFTYISRWVPVPDPERPRRPPATEQAAIYRELLADPKLPQSRTRWAVRRGVLGLTALGLAGWAFRSSRTHRKDPP